MSHEKMASSSNVTIHRSWQTVCSACQFAGSCGWHRDTEQMMRYMTVSQRLYHPHRCGHGQRWVLSFLKLTLEGILKITAIVPR